MANNVIDGLSSGEKHKVYEVTADLERFLADYYGQFQSYDSVRFPPTALTTAAENPDLPIDVLQNIVMVPVWIFTIDAVIDEKLITGPELYERLRKYQDIVLRHTTEVDPKDEYGRVLLQIQQNVESKPLYHALRTVWQESYCRMIDGMMFETYGDRYNVTFDQYVEHGLYSIGVPTYVTATWILQSTNESLQHQEDMLRMMRLSGISIRLANDLRTYEKERAENNLNSIFIKEMEFTSQGLSEDDAKQAAFQFIRNQLSEAMSEFYDLCDDDIPLKRALKRLTEFSVSFYHEHDFHTVSAEQIRNL